MPSLAERIKAHGQQLGFQQVGITNVDLSTDERRLAKWLKGGHHGTMHFLAKHGKLRTRPERLIPGTVRIISVRMDYLPSSAESANGVLADKRRGYISRYALGRDYHKMIRKRLKKLADYISTQVEDHGYRVFTDSAPVLEKALARKAGIGWVGKHTLVINSKAGSHFFLGEIYTNIPLPVDESHEHDNYCGTCNACIDVCPTQAIIAPYKLDAKRCISYLTIENKGAIPVEFRKAIGNRVYGCDDCQLVCPWNKFSHPTAEADFAPRHGLDNPQLVDLFGWDEQTYLSKTEGMAIRRAGYEGWVRNIAVALGNAPSDPDVIAALRSRRDDPSALIREHVEWALSEHAQRASSDGANGVA